MLGATLAVGRLDEHRHALTDPLLGPLAGELLDEVLQTRDPLVDDLLRQVVGQSLGLGAVLVGVPEHPDDVEPRGDQEALELLDVGLGLAREPDDDVGADPGGRAPCARTVPSRSRKASVLPNRRIRRSTVGEECWKLMSK